MGLSRTVSEIDGDFSQKSQNFPTPLYFPPPWNRVSALGVKKLGPTKKVDDIFSHLDTIYQRDRRTDRQMDGHRATAKTALTHSIGRTVIKD